MSGPPVIDIEVEPVSQVAAKVVELAQLSPLEYDQQREQVAKDLKVRVSTLDAEVAKARGVETEQHADQVVEEISPWPESVNGADLLNQIQRLYRRHCVMQPKDYVVLPLMALGTYVFDAFSVFLRIPRQACH